MVKGEDTNTEQTNAVPSVSSAQKRPGKTVSFTLPNVPKPKLPKSPSAPKTKRAKTALLVVGFLATVFLSSFAGAWFQSRNDDGLNSVTVGNQKKIVTSESQLISHIADTVGPSVVSVNSAMVSNSSSNFFGYSQPQETQGAGTGIIISADGYVMTNRHVVPSGTTKVSITLSDGTELKDVKVVGRTSENDSLDVAFLKIGDTKGKKLQAATIGDSGTVRVGDNVVAIGNALGQFQNTVTSGIISGYGRSVQAGDSSGDESSTENLDNLFQTDAAINAGNSGGPLVNLNGQVIGINTAVAGGDAQNIGFAIPINDVKGLIDQVLKDGKIERPYLGVHYISLSADVAKEYDLSAEKGAFILPSSDSSSSSVIAGGPADKAGVKEKDIIVAVDGTKIDQTHSLTSLLSQHKPGDKVKLNIIRDGKQIELTATLEAMPSSS